MNNQFFLITSSFFGALGMISFALIIVSLLTGNATLIPALSSFTMIICGMFFIAFCIICYRKTLSKIKNN